jgi:hypothetical protein
LSSKSALIGISTSPGVLPVLISGPFFKAFSVVVHELIKFYDGG